MKMSNNKIDNWADAIFQIFKEDKKLKKLEEECLGLIKLFRENEKFLDILKTSTFDINNRKKIIDQTFEKYISLTLLNAIKLMVDKNAISNIILILKKVIFLIDDNNNVTYGTIYSAINLDNDQLEKITKKVSLKLKRKVKFINKIDNKIIAGLRIVVGSMVFDYSFANKLKELRNKIISSNFDKN